MLQLLKYAQITTAHSRNIKDMITRLLAVNRSHAKSHLTAFHLTFDSLKH